MPFNRYVMRQKNKSNGYVYRAPWWALCSVPENKKALLESKAA